MYEFTEREKELVDLYRQFNPEDKGEIRGIMRALISADKKTDMLISMSKTLFILALRQNNLDTT